MNIIVIDTCIFENTKDYFFKKPQLRLIKDLNKYGIYIPKIVIDEINSHLFDLCKNINEKVKNCKENLVNKYRNLLEYNINLEIPNIDFDRKILLEQYSSFEKKYIDVLKKEKINIQNTPKDFNIDKVFKRIFERKYPFKTGGDKGIKDYAIWETIVELMKNKQQDNFIFITENSKDFLENGDIPDDFKNDLLEKQISPERLRILSLKNYLEELIDVPPEQLFEKLKTKFIPQLKSKKYTQYSYPLSFEDFVMQDARLEDMLDITPFFGYCYNLEFAEELNIKEETIKCVDIENDNIYIELNLTAETNAYVEDTYVGDLYIIINISRGVSYYSNESNSGTIWIIILIVIGIIGFAIFKFLSSTNVDSEIANNMPKPLGCDNYSIKSSVINNFKENNLYYKYIDESSISEIDLLYPSETQFDEENGIYYCKGVITVKSNQDGFKPTSDNDKNNYYSNIHQVNNENGEEKLLKYTKYEYNIEYKSYISDGEPTIEVINSSDNNVGEFYCNGSCEPEIIKEAEVYNTHEEDYSNNYNYDENNVNYEKESTQNRSQNNTKQRSYNNVDFSNYMSNIENRIKNNWYPPKSNTTSRAVVLFELNRNGEVISAKIKQSSGNALCDKAAISAIENTHFDPLPSEYEGDSVPIEFSFDYNVVNRR